MITGWTIVQCLSGRLPLLIWWRHSDDKASLSSSEIALELPTGTELGNMNYNRGYSCSVTMCCHNHIVNIICGLLGITNQFNLTGIFPRQITQICSGNLITVIFICAKFSEYCKLWIKRVWKIQRQGLRGKCRKFSTFEKVEFDWLKTLDFSWIKTHLLFFVGGTLSAWILVRGVAQTLNFSRELSEI